MMNAPRSALARITAILPGRRRADGDPARRPRRPRRRARGVPGIGVLGDAGAAQGRRRLGDPGSADRKDDVRCMRASSGARLAKRERRRRWRARHRARRRDLRATGRARSSTMSSARAEAAVERWALQIDGFAPRARSTLDAAAIARARGVLAPTISPRSTPPPTTSAAITKRPSPPMHASRHARRDRAQQDWRPIERVRPLRARRHGAAVFDPAHAGDPGARRRRARTSWSRPRPVATARLDPAIDRRGRAVRARSSSG